MRDRTTKLSSASPAPTRVSGFPIAFEAAKTLRGYRSKQPRKFSARTSVVCWLVAVLLTHSLLLIAQSPAAPEQIQKLLQQLDSPVWQLREEATKKLTEFWEDDTAVKQIEEASKVVKEQEHAEIKMRTKRILDRINLRQSL